jgi:hypothetical protein
MSHSDENDVTLKEFAAFVRGTADPETHARVARALTDPEHPLSHFTRQPERPVPQLVASRDILLRAGRNCVAALPALIVLTGVTAFADAVDRYNRAVEFSEWFDPSRPINAGRLLHQTYARFVTTFVDVLPWLCGVFSLGIGADAAGCWRRLPPKLPVVIRPLRAVAVGLVMYLAVIAVVSVLTLPFHDTWSPAICLIAANLAGVVGLVEDANNPAILRIPAGRPWKQLCWNFIVHSALNGCAFAVCYLGYAGLVGESAEWVVGAKVLVALLGGMSLAYLEYRENDVSGSPQESLCGLVLGVAAGITLMAWQGIVVLILLIILNPPWPMLADFLPTGAVVLYGGLLGAIWAGYCGLARFGAGSLPLIGWRIFRGAIVRQVSVAYVLPGIVSVGAYTLGVPWALVGYIASASAVAMSLWWMNKSLNAMAAAHAPGYSFILSTLKVLEEKAKHQRERMFWRWTRRAA